MWHLQVHRSTSSSHKLWLNKWVRAWLALHYALCSLHMEKPSGCTNAQIPLNLPTLRNWGVGTGFYAVMMLTRSCVSQSQLVHQVHGVLIVSRTALVWQSTSPLPVTQLMGPVIAFLDTLAWTVTAVSPPIMKIKFINWCYCISESR